MRGSPETLSSAPSNGSRRRARTETAYRALFGVLTFAALAAYSRSRDVRPSDEMRGREQQRAP
jgi:hypothetical protein